MVTNDIVCLGILYATIEVHQVVEALVSLGKLWTSIVWERSMQEVDDFDRIDHLPLS